MKVKKWNCSEGGPGFAVLIWLLYVLLLVERWGWRHLRAAKTRVMNFGSFSSSSAKVAGSFYLQSVKRRFCLRFHLHSRSLTYRVIFPFGKELLLPYVLPNFSGAVFSTSPVNSKSFGKKRTDAACCWVFVVSGSLDVRHCWIPTPFVHFIVDPSSCFLLWGGSLSVMRPLEKLRGSFIFLIISHQEGDFMEVSAHLFLLRSGRYEFHTRICAQISIVIHSAPRKWMGRSFFHTRLN